MFSCNLHFWQNDWDLLCYLGDTGVVTNIIWKFKQAEKVDHGKENYLAAPATNARN